MKGQRNKLLNKINNHVRTHEQRHKAFGHRSSLGTVIPKEVDAQEFENTQTKPIKLLGADLGLLKFTC